PRLAGGGHEDVEVLDRAQVWVHGRVAALGRPDGPRAPGIVGARPKRVVRALTGRPADGMDRREVDDVEAHGRYRFDAFGGAPEAAIGPGDELVPGAGRRPLPVRPQR